MTHVRWLHGHSGRESTDHTCGLLCRWVESSAHRLRARTRTRAEVNVRPRPLVQATEHTKIKSNSQETRNSNNATTKTTYKETTTANPMRHESRWSTLCRRLSRTVLLKVSISHSARCNVACRSEIRIPLPGSCQATTTVGESRQAASISIDGFQDERHCLLGGDNEEPRRAWCQLVFGGKTGRVVQEDEAHNVLQCIHKIFGGRSPL